MQWTNQFVVVVVVVAATAWPSAYRMWEMERKGAKTARIRPDQSARTNRVRRARRLPPYVSVIGTGQLPEQAAKLKSPRRCPLPLQVV